MRRFQKVEKSLEYSRNSEKSVMVRGYSDALHSPPPNPWVLISSQLTFLICSFVVVQSLSRILLFATP